MKIFSLLALLMSNPVFAYDFVEPYLKQTHMGSTPAFAPPANATDLCTLYGSATKKVSVVGVEVYTNQTTTGTNEYRLIKRSAANSGGGATDITEVAIDSGNASPTATVQYYVNSNASSLGTAAGTLLVKRALSPASTALGIPGFSLLAQELIRYSPIVLRGTSEGIAVSFNGATVPSGLSVGCTFRWVEE